MANKYLPKLHLACSDDDIRPALEFISIIDNVGYATEGHLVIAINLKYCSGMTEDVLEKLNGKFVHRNTWKKIIDAVELTIENDEIVYVDGSIKAKFLYETDVKFPDVISLLNETIQKPETETSHFGFSLKLINILVNVFNSNEIYFLKKGQNFLAYPSVGSYQYAMICPIMIVEGGFEFDFNINN